MANTYVAIATVTVGAGGTSSFQFTSIPQTYTDLKIVFSGRGDFGATYDVLGITFNNSTSGYSGRYITGSGSSTASNSQAPSTYVELLINGSTATASTFGNLEVYIPNYTSSNQKSISADSVNENNATQALSRLHAGLWTGTAAISSIQMTISAGTLFSQYTTATLYGIKSS